MAAPTVQEVAAAILLDWGITSFSGTGPNAIRTVDRSTCALVMNQAFQVIAEHAQGELKTQPGSAYLRGPTSLTLTVTEGDTAISALTPYAAWMLGCTIRVEGDDQDNEILSNTRLARPVIAATGATAATVYGDCITLGDTVGKIVGPMLLANAQVAEATTRHDFLMLGGYSLFAGFDYTERFASYPFWTLARKAISDRPMMYFVDGYYDPSLDYIQRRIRLSPMPSAAQSIGWTSHINPMRVSASELETATKIPCVNGWIESIFLPIARQIGTGAPQFKNQEMKAELLRQYQAALARLAGTAGSDTRTQTCYT